MTCYDGIEVIKIGLHPAYIGFLNLSRTCELALEKTLSVVEPLNIFSSELCGAVTCFGASRGVSRVQVFGLLAVFGVC